MTNVQRPESRAPRTFASQIPLVLFWAVAVTPFAIYLLHRTDPELAVAVANGLSRWSLRVAITVPIVLLLAAAVFPPVPAWLRLQLDRTRTTWTMDRAPLQRALGELEHLQTAQRHFEVAKLAWLRGDLPLASEHAAKAVALDADMPAAQHLLGQVALRANDAPRAREAFATAERLEPGHAFGNALLLQARCTHLLGDVDAALEWFAQHEREHGGGHRSQYWYGLALDAAGRRDEASERLRAAARDPGQRLTTEENWFRALARVRCIGRGGKS